MDAHQRRAFDMLTSRSVAEAYDITRSPTRFAIATGGIRLARVRCWRVGWWKLERRL